MVKNLFATQETWVRPLGWEDPLEKRKAIHSSILAWRIPWTTVHRVAKSQTRQSNIYVHFQFDHGTLLTKYIPSCSVTQPYHHACTYMDGKT